MESDPRRKEYGRMIYGLKDEYTSQASYHGDENLLEAAAKIRAGESVYDKQPTEKQGRLLRAADIQRKKGIGKQLKKDYKSAGVSPRVAEAAGDIKAQEFVFGTELSEKQQKRIDEADGQLTSVEGQLKRQQQLELAESQIPKAYQEGRLTQTLEDAGVPAELAGKAAKIEASTGGEPQNQEDADILSQAYASAGNAEQDASNSDTAITEAATNANQFLNSASLAGITEKVGDAEVAQGKNYNMTRTGSTTVVKNRETEATLVTQGNEVLASEGISDDDRKRLAKLGQLSPDQIRESIEQSTQTTEQSSQIETSRPSPKSKLNAKPNEVEI